MLRPDRTAGTVVLIHGAWQGSWVWERLAPLLDGLGLDVIAVDLPGNGTDDTPPEAVTLDLYVDHIGEAIADASGPITLVGHSGGGLTATAAAERYRERIAGVAYVAGMMLPSGISFADLLVDVGAAEKGLVGIGPFLTRSPDGVSTSVPADAAADIFLSDMPRDEALRLVRRLTPQPRGGREMAANWTPQRYGALPRLYVECADDRSVALTLQRRMQELVPGAQSVTLHTGHAPQVSAPAALADALLPFLLQRKEEKAGTGTPTAEAAQSSFTGCSPSHADRDNPPR